MAKPSTAAQERKRLAKLEARRIVREYQEPRPERLPPPITLPATSYREIADADLGLPENPGAQMKAESYLHYAYARWLRDRDIAHRQAQAAPVVNFEVDDEALHLDHVTLKRIGDELQRIADRPPSRWRNPHPLSG